MIDSDNNIPSEGKSATFATAHTHTRRSMGSLSQASQFPSTPKGATKAPLSKFNMMVAQLSNEFAQVSEMLEREISHREHLEDQVASLIGELEKQAGMADCGKSRWQANQNELYHNLGFQDMTQVTPIKTDDVMLKDSSQSGHNHAKDAHSTMREEQLEDLENAHKTRKEEQLEDLELIRGWKGCKLERSQSFVEQAGMVRVQTRRIVQTPTFDAICSIFIIYNATLLGAAADYAAVNHSNPQEPPMFYRVSDRVCTVWFLLELMIRLSSDGIRDFFMGPLWSWNSFDFIVVASDVLMTIVDIIATEWQVDLSFLRILRVLRVTRAIRVVRLVRFFKELRMMVFSVLRSGTSLLWSLILFGMIHYIFGIFLMQQVNDYLWEEYAGDFMSVSAEANVEISNFQLYWGSLSSAMYTLYACMSGGVSWKDVSDDLLVTNWLNSAILGFFIFFCTVVVMNIITGIFVDTAIQSAQSDREEIIQEQIHSQESELAQLKQAFLEADNDGSASIDLREFQHHLQDPRIRAHLASIGLEIHEAMGLFKLLDIDGSGHVGIEEFVIGCMRLKGSAKSIDLATLMYENKRMVEQHSHFHEFCERKFSEILVATESLRLEMSIPMLVPQGDKQYLV